jgi:hypothetical protein
VDCGHGSPLESQRFATRLPDPARAGIACHGTTVAARRAVRVPAPAVSWKPVCSRLAARV